MRSLLFDFKMTDNYFHRIYIINQMIILNLDLDLSPYVMKVIMRSFLTIVKQTVINWESVSF